jgi:hypothetical protein
MKVKRLGIMFCLLVLSGCGMTTEVDVTITKLVTEDKNSGWGCLSTDTRTVFRGSNDHIGYLCGDYGNVGDTFKLYYTTGAFDPSMNGFKMKH